MVNQTFQHILVSDLIVGVEMLTTKILDQMSVLEKIEEKHVLVLETYM